MLTTTRPALARHPVEPVRPAARPTGVPRRTRLSLGSALALALLLTSCTAPPPSPEREGPESATAQRTESSAPAASSWPTQPPEGYRWTGRNGVVVAVPARWSTGGTQCLLPVEDTVYVETGGITDCAVRVPDVAPRRVSSLAVVSTRKAHGERLLESLRPDGEAGGEAVLTGQECGWLGRSTCRTVLAVPARGVAFALHVAEPRDIDLSLFRDSLTVLPDDWTTVPLALPYGYTPLSGAPPATVRAYVRLLRRHGLGVRVEDSGRSPSPRVSYVPPRGSLLGIRPQPGSPIRKGGQVVVTVWPSRAG